MQNPIQLPEIQPDEQSTGAIPPTELPFTQSTNIRGIQDTYNLGNGFWLGIVDGVAKFSIGDASGNILTWDGTTLTVNGTFNATAGTIGGFTIGATTVSATNLTLTSGAANVANITVGTGANAAGLNAGNGASDILIWAGSTYANRATAPFRVTGAGAVTASNVTITGGSISSGVTVATGALNIGTMGWTTDIVFSSASATQINWTSGSIVMQNGTTYTINSGNTGAMAALTYIYLDIAVSITVLQKTTTYSTATGDGKVLIATAQNNTVGASVVPQNGSQAIIDGTAQIAALSITAASIAATTITAAKLSVSQLSAISADLGTITAGVINLSTSGNIHSGQSAYNTGTGWWLEYNGGTPRLSIGNPATNYLTWDGTNLTVKGTVPDTQTYTTGSNTWTKPAGANFVTVVCIGGGGGGGAAANNETGNGASGGGGASFVTKTFKASDLPSTVTVTVGAGGTAGTSVGANGTAGGNSTFGTFLTGYGGGAGAGGGNNSGGGGAGTAGAGNAGNSSSDIAGGSPAVTAAIAGISGQGGGSTQSGTGYAAEYGGGGGGGSHNATNNGGDSMFGAGAGGGGGDGGTPNNGGAGGGVTTYSTGSGAAGGASANSSGTAGAGTAGTDGNSSKLGTGGGGGGGNKGAAGTGGVGGAGGALGGGGGGGGAGHTHGNGGIGGRGEVRVYTT